MLKTTPYKILLKYAIPAILGLLAISSASIVDGYFIGNYVGSVGLASINISYPITSVLFAMALMFAVGSSVLVGKLMGEQNTQKACDVFTKSMISVLLTSIAVCSFLFLVLQYVLDLLGVGGELAQKTMQYLSILLFFLPFLMSGIVLDYFVRIDENPNLSFSVLLVSSIVNIGLDYIFIVIFGWGIEGAAYATGISQAMIIFMLLPHFFTKKSTLCLVKPKGSWNTMLKILKNGSSEFVNEASAGIVVLIFNFAMLKAFGTNGVASYTIIGYFIMINTMVSFAISDALQTIMSKNYGARLFERMDIFLKLGFCFVLAIEAVLVFLVLLIPDIMVGLFLQDTQSNTKQIAIEFVSYAWFAFLFAGLNIFITSYLTSVQKPLHSFVIATTRSLILPIFLVFALPLAFGKIGIFMSISVAEIITFLIALFFLTLNRPSLIQKRT